MKKNNREFKAKKRKINHMDTFVINDAAIDGVITHSWDDMLDGPLTAYPTFYFCKYDWRVYENNKIWHAKNRDKQLKRRGYIPYCKVSFWDIVVSYMKMEDPESYQYICEHDTPKQSLLMNEVVTYMNGGYNDLWFDEYLKHQITKSLIEWCDENELPCEVINRLPFDYFCENVRKFLMRRKVDFSHLVSVVDNFASRISENKHQKRGEL